MRTLHVSLLLTVALCLVAASAAANSRTGRRHAVRGTHKARGDAKPSMLNRFTQEQAREAAEELRMQRVGSALALADDPSGGEAGAEPAPKNYDKYEMPEQADPDTPMVVLTDLRIFHLYDVKDKEQTAHIDMLLELDWHDGRLAYSPEDLAPGRKSKRVDVSTIWTPGLTVVNAHEPPKIVQEDATVSPTGVVRYVRRMDLVIVAQLDMTHFPFDEHDLSTAVDSFAYDASQLLLTASNTSTSYDAASLSGPIWVVSDWSVREDQVATLLSPRDSIIVATFHIKRDPSGAFLEIIVPLTLIAIFALSASYVGLKHLDVRVGIASTAMLTVMAYLFVVENELPEISYLVWVHYYTMTCFLFVFLVLMEVVLIHRMDPKNEEDAEQTISDNEGDNEWESLKRSLSLMVNMRSASAVHAVMRHLLPVLFALAIFILFFIERPVHTIVVTIVIIVIAIALRFLIIWAIDKLHPTVSDGPRSVDEADALAKAARERLQRSKKRSMRDAVLAASMQSRADRMRRTESGGSAEEAGADDAKAEEGAHSYGAALGADAGAGAAADTDGEEGDDSKPLLDV